MSEEKSKDFKELEDEGISITDFAMFMDKMNEFVEMAKRGEDIPVADIKLFMNHDNSGIKIKLEKYDGFTFWGMTSQLDPDEFNEKFDNTVSKVGLEMAKLVMSKPHVEHTIVSKEKAS